MSDTKIDKQRHEASGRHKYAIRSYINGLHKQNRDEVRDDRMAQNALRDIERDMKASTKSFADTNTAATTITSTNIPKPRPKPVAAAASTTADHDLDAQQTPTTIALLFQKKAREKKIDPDLAAWSYAEKAIKPGHHEDDLAHIDLLRDDDSVKSNTAAVVAPPPPKKHVFKKRQIRVSK